MSIYFTSVWLVHDFAFPFLFLLGCFVVLVEEVFSIVIFLLCMCTTLPFALPCLV